MSDDKFVFIDDEEIEQILGKQEEDSPSEPSVDAVSSRESKEREEEEYLSELLAYKDERHEEKEEVEISPVQFREFTDEEDDNIEIDMAGLGLLQDVPIEISVILGSVSMEIGKLSKIGIGTKIPLKKLAGEPVEVHVGGILIAKGETVVVDNEEVFGVRITEILSERERIMSVYETLKKQKQL